MVKRVLVPYDGSEQSEKALDYAVDEFGDETIVALNVIDPVDAGYASSPTGMGNAEEWYANARETAEGLLDAASDDAADRGVEIETAVELGRPARMIVSYADENDVDHVVMGSHGRSGVSRILLGSVTEQVVRRSPVPVTVVR